MSERLEAALRELADALLDELRADAPADDLPDRLLSVADAAAALSIGRTALYSEMNAGRLRSMSVGRRRLIPASALAAYTKGEAA